MIADDEKAKRLLSGKYCKTCSHSGVTHMIYMSESKPNKTITVCYRRNFFTQTEPIDEHGICNLWTDKPVVRFINNTSVRN